MTDPRVTSAIHEAGHCVTVCALGYRLLYVAINDEGGGGETAYRRQHLQGSIGLETELACAVAGFVCDGGTAPEEAYRGDRESAGVALARRRLTLPPGATRDRVRRAHERVRAIITEHDRAVTRIAELLVRHGRVEGIEARRIVERERRRTA